MQEAVPVGTGAMAAILGLDADAVAQACEEPPQGEVVSPGESERRRAGRDRRRARRRGARGRARQGAGRQARGAAAGQRAVPLRADEAGRDRLAPELRALDVHDPRVPIVANVDAELKRDAAAAIEALIAQVSSPVRWEAVVRRLASEGVTTYVEVGPGTVLSGLVRKIHRDATVAQFRQPGRSRRGRSVVDDQ